MFKNKYDANKIMKYTIMLKQVRILLKYQMLKRYVYKCFLKIITPRERLLPPYLNYVTSHGGIEYARIRTNMTFLSVHTTQYTVHSILYQWRSEGNWRPGANLNFAPPPQKNS